VSLEEQIRDVALRVDDDLVHRKKHLDRLEKIPKFAQRLSLAVHDGLRTCVERGAADIEEFWRVGFGGGDAAVEKGGGDQHAFARHRPLFVVKLVIRNGAVAFDPPLYEVVDAAVALFDDATTGFEGVTCVKEKVVQHRGAFDALTSPAAESKTSSGGNVSTVEFSVSQKNVPTPAADEKFIVDKRASILHTITENLAGPTSLAKRFARFEELMGGPGNAETGVCETRPEPPRAVKELASLLASLPTVGDAHGTCELPPVSSQARESAATDEPPRPERTLPELELELRRLSTLIDEIFAACGSFEPFRMIGVDCVLIVETLVEVARKRRQGLIDKLVTDFHKLNSDAYARFTEISERLRRDVETPEQLDDLRRFAAGAVVEVGSIEKTLAKSGEMSALLERNLVSLDDDVVGTFWNASSMPSSMPAAMKTYELRGKELQKKMTETLKLDIKALGDAIKLTKNEVAEFIELGQIDLAEDRLVTVESIETKLRDLKKQGEVFALREELFDRPVTPYPLLNSLVREWEPYANLWRVCAEFGRSSPEWQNGPFPQLDAEAINAQVELWNRQITKMFKLIKAEKGEKPLQVLGELKRRISNFELVVPIINALRNPGLRDRHWKEMSDELGILVKADGDFSLARAVQIGLNRHIETLERYSEAASKEYSLERGLDAMTLNWRGVVFKTGVWRDTGSFVLKNTDDTQTLLDDQIVKTQSMRSSPYIGPFEDRVQLWEKKLTTIQEVLDQWLKMQSGWLYLVSISVSH
tara:strand:- start:22099 stop:24378 length:2280 start_codon:yes stop_codon:yes gene_type:complete